MLGRAVEGVLAERSLNIVLVPAFAKRVADRPVRGIGLKGFKTLDMIVPMLGIHV